MSTLAMRLALDQRWRLPYRFSIAAAMVIAKPCYKKCYDIGFGRPLQRNVNKR